LNLSGLLGAQSIHNKTWNAVFLLISLAIAYEVLEGIYDFVVSGVNRMWNRNLARDEIKPAK
jgi:hypothetical protein